MTIQVNGEPREFAEDLTLPGLLNELGLPSQSALIEHNGVALFRTDWDGVRLAAGDRVEIIRVVAGG